MNIIVPEIHQRRTYVESISNKVQEGGHLYLNAYNCTVPIFCPAAHSSSLVHTVPYPLLVGSETKILNVRLYVPYRYFNDQNKGTPKPGGLTSTYGGELKRFDVVN